ncbi:deoxyribonuclease V [Marinobacter vulgaris]|uniref:Endonuclease V n=1 Tax=Marinobacter vulgaris TaxID=1928331 RepID=A0A2V3ZKH9_9GAMM|nr:deoxyribonuclease V [Marinobacter vulgaris]PXX91554.1 deoxyribonuclease V [Marinobacter vulgaris]TSJ70945.1 deoxyribonuclease V [Marinobacter vulgaris]
MEHWAGLTPKQAMELQRQAASQVITVDDLPEVRMVAGVDVGFEGHETARAAIVVLRLDDLEPVDYAVARLPAPMPYIPGLLSFRECPVILKALSRLTIKPDVLLCDGQGIAHPRRLGVASHTGLLTGLPSIGVGKSRLIGSHGSVPENRGEWTPLVDKGEDIGAVLRTRAGVKPLFISPGHRISLAAAVHYVMRCTTRYRLPETTRWADGVASARSHRWLDQLKKLPRARGPEGCVSAD